MKLDGNVALITGAARGIGLGIAKRFVAAGGRVVIADLDLDSAANAATRLGPPSVAMGVAMDVTSEEQVNAGVAGATRLNRRVRAADPFRIEGASL